MLISSSCDRYFVIADGEVNAAIDGSIVFELDSTNALNMTMSLTGNSINNNEIVDIKWTEEGGSQMCQ